MADSQPTRYLFVDCPDPKKLKLDRSKGSKSHVRAHVTKEYHRRVRMERLQAFKEKDPNGLPPTQLTATGPGTSPVDKERPLPIRTNEPNSTSASSAARGGAARGRGRGRGRGQSQGQGRAGPATGSATGAGGKGKGKGKGKVKEEEQGVASADNHSALALVPISPSSSSSSSKTTQEPSYHLWQQQQQQQQQQQSDNVREMGIRSLNYLLSQNRSDPFNCLSIPDLPRHSQKLLDYALTNTWPETVPVKGKSLDNPINRAWLQTCLDYPIMMHAFLYAASTQMALLLGDREDPAMEKIRLAHYSESIKQLHKQISTLEGMPPDALLMTIVTLAVHGRPGKEQPRQCHPKSPLHKLQYLHIYGSMHLAHEHLPALMSLLERKGGVGEVSTYGMLETFQLADIYFGTLDCARPYFGLVKEPPLIFANEKIKLDQQGVAMMSELLSGFKYLHPSPPCGQQLAEALRCIREITVAVDMIERRVPGAPALCELVPCINMGQHKMLSVDVHTMVGNSEEVSIVCIARLASLIYNDMVIYPCPEIQGVKIRAGTKLREALEYHLGQFDFRRHARLLLWATVMGSIATSFTQGQPWFLTRLQWQAWELALNDWPSLRSLCCKFLWWAPVCDEPGLRIWNDMITQGSMMMVGQAID